MKNNFKHSSKIKYPISEEIRRQIEKLSNPQKHEVKNMEYGVTYDSIQLKKYSMFEHKLPFLRLVCDSVNKETQAKLFDTNQEPDKTNTVTLGAAAQQVAIQHQEPDKDTLETLGAAHQADID